ncbi:MAG: hypothetical protein NZ480_00635, partial [Bdellovibrionaceae bacterium]|nr:hypothetical protein [Pseudobdellovibrionaceae bacterium]MDW8191303.1 hypothetical protein [Pseudobdellovibrionaceae bacterium]
MGPLHKAREINQDPTIYGTFAEIGAGQEVARYFFLAGQASQTVAKTMSAYDMTFSDEIYGREPSGRYVCQNRLLRMLDKEYSLLERRLKEKRGATSRFFVLANTVATKSPKVRISHGWMGVTFQLTPLSAPNRVILHAKLLESNRLWQQETLGVLGVNLLHACYYHYQSPENLLQAITDGLKNSQLQIDFLSVEGEVFSRFHNVLLNVALVNQGWSDATAISPEGKVVLISDEIYGKSIMVQRGHFYPPTKTHLEIPHRALQLAKNEWGADFSPKIFFEISLDIIKNSYEKEIINQEALLHRIEMVNAIGYPVLITQFKEFYRTKELFRISTELPIIFIISARNLEKVFSPEYYHHLPGGWLEGLGKLLDEKTRLYVFPFKTPTECLTTKSLFLKSPNHLIFQYFLETQLVRDLAEC